jgi:hypothetical protein
MRGVAQRKLPAENPPPSPAHVPESAAPTTVVVWVEDGPVCVGSLDLPSACAPSGVCRCPACHGALEGDLAIDYFPAR